MTAERHTVAHLLPWPGVGGTEHATLRVIEATRAAGYASIAYCLERADDVAEFFRDAAVPVERWRLARPVVRDALRYRRTSRRLARSFRERHIDLVHCADVRAAVMGGASAARRARLPILCHVRNRYDRLWPPMARPLAAVDHFAFVSRDTWRRFAYNVRDDAGTVVYDAVPVAPVAETADTDAVRRELGVPADARIIGSVARIEPQKDFMTLARAAARITEREPRAIFLVVGGYDRTPEQREHYGAVRDEIAAAGVTDRFIFTGFRDDVPRLLHAIDVFVLSTHWEGLPLVVLEAMAHGRPVVATAVDGIPEVIDDGRNGVLVPHQHDAALAAAVLALLAEPVRAAALGEAARTTIAGRHGPERFQTDLAALYRAVIGRADGEPDHTAPQRPARTGAAVGGRG